MWVYHVMKGNSADLNKHIYGTLSGFRYENGWVSWAIGMTKKIEDGVVD